MRSVGIIFELRRARNQNSRLHVFTSRHHHLHLGPELATSYRRVANLHVLYQQQDIKYGRTDDRLCVNCRFHCSFRSSTEKHARR